MTKPTLIGLTGLAGSGKDSVRIALECNHDYNGLALADPIKTMISALVLMVGADIAYCEERALKEKPIPGIGKSYRELAQSLGTEWGREIIGLDLWTRIAERRIEQFRVSTFGSMHMVISDIRFASEAQWITERGGVIWQVHRPHLAPVRAHVSEIGVPPYYISHTINNAGSLQDLRKAVADAMDTTHAPR